MDLIKQTYPTDLPPTPVFDAATRAHLIERIKHLLSAGDFVLVAHYYTHEDLQQLADETGGCVADSLEMARFGHAHAARNLVVAGVRFMGETAKILSPEKRVFMPDLRATCSLDIGCPADAFSAFCDRHPERTVVVYANTSVAVKARADWVVTSRIALPLISHLRDLGQPILWAPDKHLGGYIQRQTDADMLLWEGACIVHEEFKLYGMEKLRARYPDAGLLVHPEAPQALVDAADVVGSTSELIAAVTRLPHQHFIVATEQQIFYKMRQAAPDKTFTAAPTAGRGATCQSCAHCPWMAMNHLQNLAQVLEHGGNEIQMDPALAQRAREPLTRMLDFQQHGA